jgi:mono/diheme cytochrome c family protein
MKRILAIALFASALTAADDAAGMWTGKVLPILQERCIGCHGPEKQKHGLRVDSLEALLKGGKDYGPAVIPGKADESAMVKVLELPRDDELSMPPKAKGPPLSAEQIAVIKAWITAGAKVP